MSDDYISDDEKTQEVSIFHPLENGIDAPQVMPNLHKIPKSLRAYADWPQWVNWLQDTGDMSEPGKLEEVYEACREHGYGLGFILTDKDLISVVHLPDCFDPDTRMMHIIPNNIMRALKTYTEFDHTGQGVHLILQAKGEANIQGKGVKVWTEGYMIPLTGDRFGEEEDAVPRQNELRSVIETYCDMTWEERAERLQGSGSEEEILKIVMEECLSTPGWAEDYETTGLYPFLAKCFAYPALRVVFDSRVKDAKLPYRMVDNLVKATESYMPKKERKPKADRVPEGRDGLQGQYQWTKQGQIKESQANWEIMLEQEPHWQGRLRFNDFYRKVELDGEVISELSRAEVSSWASHNLELSGSNITNRDQALLVAAAKDKYDPLQEYINGLPAWDATRRLETLFPDYFGSENDVYARWLGRTMPVCMIARGLIPACICRYVVVLKGPQDIGKSEAVRALGGEWTVELSGDLGSRDSQIQLKGVWVVELGELNSVRKSHRDEAKRFVSSRYDEFTLKHLNDSAKYPRRCVFIGTSNADEVLNDPTGSTRWFPIKVTKADYQAIARDRDQLLAEALAWYQQHKNDWWIIPPEVQPILDAMREESREVGPYEEKISKWLINGKKKHTTWPEIAEECLNLSEGQWKSVQMSVADSLRALGWTKRQELATPGSKRKVRRWYPPDNWLADDPMPNQDEQTDSSEDASDELDDEMKFMLGRIDYAKPITPKLPCRTCGSAIGVNPVTGDCQKCH